MRKSFQTALLLTAATFASVVAPIAAAADTTLLNVSYDPTRELYQQINPHFVAYWKERTGDTVTVRQSHGGSSKQARAIVDGLEADVATLGIASDLDALHEHGELLPANWQDLLPGEATPYVSTIVFLVRKGNPKDIKDWGDLVKPGISVITPNPKTSAGARWNVLGAWAWALKNNEQSEEKARAYLTQLFKNVPILDTGARGSTVTFAQRGLGDVLIAWENEAHLVLKEFGANKFDIVVPPFSILAQPPVAVVEKFAKKHGTQEIAKAYLEFLYSETAQDVIAKNFYRPSNPAIASKYSQSFPQLELVNIRDFGGWKVIQPKFFGDGGIFDQIYGIKK
jgi:sulfate/thiosulfate-binding protein